MAQREEIENLNSCIEKFLYRDVRGVEDNECKMEIYYVDTRYGHIIGDLHPAYMTDRAFTVKPISSIICASRKGDAFEIIINDIYNEIKLISINFYNIDNSFICRDYDPIGIISYLIKHKDFKEYFRSKNHPMFNKTYVPEYTRCPEDVVNKYISLQQASSESYEERHLASIRRAIAARRASDVERMHNRQGHLHMQSHPQDENGYIIGYPDDEKYERKTRIQHNELADFMNVNEFTNDNEFDKSSDGSSNDNSSNDNEYYVNGQKVSNALYDYAERKQTNTSPTSTSERAKYTPYIEELLEKPKKKAIVRIEEPDENQLSESYFKEFSVSEYYQRTRNIDERLAYEDI